MSFQKILDIDWQGLLQKWFWLYVLILVLTGVFLGGYVFYSIATESPQGGENILPSFSAKDLKDIGAVLDARDAEFSALRKSKSTIKNPF